VTINLRAGPPILFLVAIAALLMLPIYGISLFVARLIEIAAVFTMLVSSFNLTFGYAGELTFNQLVIFAIGGITAGSLYVHGGQTDLVVSLLVVALVGIAIGVPLGLPGLRFGYLSSAMVSLFLIQVFPAALPLLGSWTGALYGIGLPTLVSIQLDNTTFYLAVVAIAAGWLVVMRNLVASHLGERLEVLRTSPILARSLGLQPLRLKLTVYALSCVPASIAGALFAYMNTVVLPVNTTGALLLLGASVIGGAVSVYGAIAAALAVEIVPYFYLSYAGAFDLLLGVGVILMALLLPGGAAEVARIVERKLHRALPAATPSRSNRLIPGLGARIVMSRARCSFGGVRALDGVEFVAEPGMVTAIVGPNGSGKTTVLNAITGAVSLQGGSIRMNDTEIVGAAADKIARAGVRRTFQTPLLPATSALSAVSGGRLDRKQPGWFATVGRLSRFRRLRSRHRLAAFEALRTVGLAEFAATPTTELPAAMRRMVEVARALAAEPSVVILDEPAAGLDEREWQALGKVLRHSADQGMTVVVVEHNLSFILSVADAMYVMSQGRVVARGHPVEVLNQPETQSAFLGGVEGFPERTTIPRVDSAVQPEPR
jgi:branched-chain amino acid transport system permease protein